MSAVCNSTRHYLNRLLLLAFAVLLPLGAAQASIFDKLIANNDGPLPVDQAYQFSAAPSGDGIYRLHWLIEDDYYLYRDKIKFEPSVGVELVEVRYPESESKQDPLFGDVQVYYHQLELLVRLESPTAPIRDASLKVEYQGCWEGGICYPPVSKNIALPMVPLKAAALPEQTADAPAGADAGFELSLTDPRQFVERLSGDNFWLTLGLFYVAGLALALTPCVFPMMPILAGVIAGHSGVMTTRKALGLSLVYVLAMSLTYTFIGVLAGLFGANLQASFQNPLVISLFSGLFVLLALAMFGFYELQMPASIQNKLDRISRSQQGGHLLGVAIMGFLSALIVGPCVAAPLAGALIYIGQTGDPVLGGWALFILSLGMGTPLLLVGASAGKLLPKAGGWMERVKQFFGVALLLMAVWMLDRVIAPQLTMVLLATVLIGCAVFMRALDRLETGAGAAAKLAKSAGVLLLVYAVMLLIGAGSGQGTLFKPLYGINGGAGVSEPRVSFTKVTSWEQLQPILEQAKRQQTPVMLDFYADWCVSCKELEAFTFADAKVIEQLNQFVTIKVDVTAHDEASKALYQRYQLIGPPALISG
jgi:thiol:disulfide interchange protein DsbD